MVGFSEMKCDVDVGNEPCRANRLQTILAVDYRIALGRFNERAATVSLLDAMVGIVRAALAQRSFGPGDTACLLISRCQEIP
jgi:hypothetical protein